MNWTLPDGDNCQGILFKPENFDSTKKYPLIFNYYETSSQALYDYHKPGWTNSSNINVPYYVSRGYLVFMPDIHIKIGDPLRSALNAVESAARILSKRGYIDPKKMALIGHSYGGFETNYIITHSNLFAAAVEGAGASNYISLYGSVLLSGSSKEWDAETGQMRIGTSLWQRPDLYLKNSAVLKADHVATPLLILHNKLDDAVPWEQGVELFTALRRLGKLCWMLQYDGEGHGLLKQENLRDYTIRQLQFFDHYLKGAPAPKWMTEGVTGRLKGINNGYELDVNGKEPQEQEVWYDGKFQKVSGGNKNR